MSVNRAGDWLKQAENDLLWAGDTLKAEKFAQACFVAQQASEKALKALAYLRGFDQVRSHSLLEIAQSLELPGNIIEAGKKLDLYYISTRYPDAFPSGAPYEYFTKDQAEEALSLAKEIILHINGFFNE
jgi:HEPN domain-containing protein